jgi:hypothetical protein
VSEDPFAAGIECGLDVVVGIASGIARRAVAHFEVDHLPIAAIDQVMAIAGSRLEPGAHAGLQQGVTRVGHQGRGAR